MGLAGTSNMDGAEVIRLYPLCKRCCPASSSNKKFTYHEFVFVVNLTFLSFGSY